MPATDPKVSVFEVLAHLLGFVVRMLFFLPSIRPRHLRALRTLAQARQSLPKQSPLHEVSAGVYQVAPDWLAQGAGRAILESEITGDEPIFVHFLGTGETLHGPLAALRCWLSYAPELARHAHLLVDSPVALRDYAGIGALQRRIWTNLESVVDRGAPGFVFVGLSRGGVIALESTARVIEEKQHVAACVAVSPPVTVPRRFAPVIRCLAGFERTAEWSDQFPAESSAGLRIRRVLPPFLRPAQRFFVAYVHSELGLADVETLRWAAYDPEHIPLFDLCKRQVGEFGMLTCTSADELRRYSRALVRRLAQTSRASTVVLYGADDTWIDVDDCCSLLDECLERVPREDDTTFSVTTRDGHGHSVGRCVTEPQDDFTKLLTTAVAAVSKLSHEVACRRRAQDRLDSYLIPPSTGMQMPPGKSHV
jgi:hypothetical protein